MRILHGASIYTLLTIVTLMTGCTVPTYRALMPQQTVNSSRTNPQFNGTVEIHSVIYPTFISYGGKIYDLPLKSFVDPRLLEKALIESVANSALFLRVEQKNADYVLDVWVDDVENHAPTWGIGDYSASCFSIWRLTRVLDGKVLICDFIDGHSLINTWVDGPRKHSLVAALKDVIQNGLRVLSDTSKEHLAAMPVAGIRPSMGSIVPEGLRAWEDKVKKNWSNLRMGLSEKEAENIIGSIRMSGALVRMYQIDKGPKPKYDTHSYSYDDREMMTLYLTHLYSLKFHRVKGLQNWTPSVM